MKKRLYPLSRGTSTYQRHGGTAGGCYVPNPSNRPSLRTREILKAQAADLPSLLSLMGFIAALAVVCILIIGS